ncbi:MAG: carbonic anhydrase [Phycisphaerales bacterium]|nr:MAG: carbonic anhydrase [Phycisphaerales bacterium]
MNARTIALLAAAAATPLVLLAGEPGHTTPSKSAPKHAPAHSTTTKSTHTKPTTDNTHAPAADAHTTTNAATDTAEPTTPDQVLAWLTEGNARWANGNTQNPNSSTQRRADTAANGQHPRVTILTCADSRLPVERIFDQGVGDLFVLRVAGNVITATEAGTIEYGLEHLHTPLLVVMGHTKCGAVTAACQTFASSDSPAPGNIGALLNEIHPAVDRAKATMNSTDPNTIAPTAVVENVWQSIFDVFQTSPATVELVREGKVKVVGAVCDISTGKVEFLGEHPWQTPLIEAFATIRNATQPAHNTPTHADAQPTHHDEH